jgi:hypothetical protein
MKCITTLLIGAGALALTACSEDGADESSLGASDAGTRALSTPAQVEAVGASGGVAATEDPSAATAEAAPARGEVPARPANSGAERQAAPQPQPSKQVTEPAPVQVPSPTPSPTCAPEHRELGHC